MDQLHKQCNALIKGKDRAVGLTSNPHVLRHWMIAGPEISWMVEDFKNILQSGEHAQNIHHKQQLGVQIFVLQVNAVLICFEEMGNQFAKDSGYLFALDTKNICEEIINTESTIHATGEE